MVDKTTIDDLKKDCCYCLKKQKIIQIKDCEIPNCHRQTNCCKKVQRDIYEKEKKNEF